MRFETTQLHSFGRVFVSSFLDWRPVYASPGSKNGDGSIAECDDPTYDPYDSDCPNVKKRIHTRVPPTPDVQNIYLATRKPTDLLWGGALCLVKEEHALAISAESFSGLEIRPVNLYRDAKCRKPVDGYVEVRPTGRVPVDLDRSGIKAQYTCPYCGFERYSGWDENKGLHFAGEYDEWPDVFMPQQRVLAAIMVKPRFARLMVELDLRPFMLVRLEDMKPFKAF